ncbi:MAG: hypothetical protein ACREOF_03270 [Gemmatimonadales bacterium]
MSVWSEKLSASATAGSATKRIAPMLSAAPTRPPPACGAATTSSAARNSSMMMRPTAIAMTMLKKGETSDTPTIARKYHAKPRVSATRR